MRFLKFSVSEFNKWRNLRNGELVVIEKQPDGHFGMREKMPYRDEENLRRDKERRELAKLVGLRRVRTALALDDELAAGEIEADLARTEEGDLDGV